MTPTDFRSGGTRRIDPLRRRRMLAGLDPGRRYRQGRLRDPARRRSRGAGARSPGPLPQGQLLGGDKTSSKSWPRWSASSRRRRSGSICPSTCAARPSSSASGRRCARSPPGSTASYTEIAQRIGAPKAVRAVAQACASNAIAVAIPCHRVVRHDGSSPDTAGAWSASGCCSTARRPHDRHPAPAMPVASGAGIGRADRGARLARHRCATSTRRLRRHRRGARAGECAALARSMTATSGSAAGS